MVENIEFELEYPRLRVKLNHYWLSFRINDDELEYDFIKHILDEIDMRVEYMRNKGLTIEEKEILIEKMLKVL